MTKARKKPSKRSASKPTAAAMLAHVNAVVTVTPKMLLAVENVKQWGRDANRIMAMMGFDTPGQAIKECGLRSFPEEVVIAEMERYVSADGPVPDSGRAVRLVIVMALRVLASHDVLRRRDQFSLQWWEEWSALAFYAQIMLRAWTFMRGLHDVNQAENEKRQKISDAVKASLKRDVSDEVVVSMAAAEKLKKKWGYLKRTGNLIGLSASAVAKIIANKTQ